MSRVNKAIMAVLISMAFIMASVVVNAHDARPVTVNITEITPLVYQLTLRAPGSVDYNNQPSLIWPAECETAATSTDFRQTIKRCPNGITSLPFFLDFPQYNPSLATFVRYTNSAGETTTMMLSPTEATWMIAEEAGLLQVAKDYSLLGAQHIMAGFDHLLFVLGLIVIAKTPRRILLTVTGFTIAHSITLILSSIGFISVPIVPVESAIALSILFLAYEISRRQKTSLSYRYPLMIAFGVGLLHGLGFASALNEIGLASNDIVLSLLFFNLGVEVGQLTFIVFVVSAFMLFSRLGTYLSTQSATIKNWQTQSQTPTSVLHIDNIAAYIIGIPSVYWFLERSFTIFI